MPFCPLSPWKPLFRNFPCLCFNPCNWALLLEAGFLADTLPQAPWNSQPSCPFLSSSHDLNSALPKLSLESWTWQLTRDFWSFLEARCLPSIQICPNQCRGQPLKVTTAYDLKLLLMWEFVWIVPLYMHRKKEVLLHVLACSLTHSHISQNPESIQYIATFSLAC